MYPVFLKMEGERAVVIGAGRVAERKIGALLDSGAQVTIVAPEATERIRALASSGNITWERRAFQNTDLDGCLLVITATDSAAINAAVYKQAVSRGQLVNSVDDPGNCNFYVPAVIHRHPLQVAISTSGRAPFFAKHFKRFFSKKLYTGIGSDIEDLGRIRDQILAESANLDQNERSQRVGEAQRATVVRILQRIDDA